MRTSNSDTVAVETCNKSGKINLKSLQDVGSLLRTMSLPQAWMVDALKKGGIAVVAVREDEWVELGYQEKAASLETEGKWRVVKKEEASNWQNKETQKIYICFVFQKL